MRKRGNDYVLVRFEVPDWRVIEAWLVPDQSRSVMRAAPPGIAVFRVGARGNGSGRSSA